MLEISTVNPRGNGVGKTSIGKQCIIIFKLRAMKNYARMVNFSLKNEKKVTSVAVNFLFSILDVGKGMK